MIAITTSSSISVNPRRDVGGESHGQILVEMMMNDSDGDNDGSTIACDVSALTSWSSTVLRSLLRLALDHHRIPRGRTRAAPAGGGRRGSGRPPRAGHVAAWVGPWGRGEDRLAGARQRARIGCRSEEGQASLRGPPAGPGRRSRNRRRAARLFAIVCASRPTLDGTAPGASGSGCWRGRLRRYRGLAHGPSCEVPPVTRHEESGEPRRSFHGRANSSNSDPISPSAF